MSASKPQWDPTYRYATSWILSPWAFFAYRATVCAFIVATRIYYSVFFATGKYAGHEESTHQFSQFTGLTNWGQAFYFLFAALHTFSYATRGRPFLASWPRFLQYAHAAFYSTILVFPIVVTAVFWSILYNDLAVSVYIQVAQHSMNSLWVLTELVLPRTRPMPWYNLLIVLALGAMYIGVAYITVDTQGYYVYTFLDPAEVGGTGIVVAYCFGLLIAAAILFGIMYGLVMLRRWLTEEKLGMLGKFSACHDGRRDSGMGGWVGGGDIEMGGKPVRF